MFDSFSFALIQAKVLLIMVVAMLILTIPFGAIAFRTGKKRFHYSYMGLFCRGTSLYGSISFTLRGMVDCMGPLASYLSYSAHLPQKVTYSPLCSSPHIPDL